VSRMRCSTTRRTRSCKPARTVSARRGAPLIRTFADSAFCFGRGGFQTRPYETPELCKVPDLQCIMAAADVRLSESRGCSTLRPCCIASGTQAPQPVTL
jgi:hypothetical protein